MDGVETGAGGSVMNNNIYALYRGDEYIDGEFGGLRREKLWFMQVTNTYGNRAIGAMLHMDGGMKYIVRDIHDVVEKQKEEDQKND